MKSRPAIQILIVFAALLSTALSTKAADLIAYQGRLLNGVGSPVADGAHSATFAFFADSLGGSVLWQETADVTTSGGLFSHMLGSVTTFPADLFSGHATLFLQITVDGEILSTRTRLASVPRAFIADDLRMTGPTGTVVGKTKSDAGGVLQLNDAAGVKRIELNAGHAGDSAVLLPDSSISADEILDEPGIVYDQNTTLMDLSTGTMSDLDVVGITTPSAGYIVVYAKCYILLSGTTGPNGAQVQIDETEGGPALYPYYTQAGLSGFVNTGTNYFPAFVTRTYYKEQGSYEFRLEGMATQPLPAVAQTWDHIMTAVFYPSEYGYVGKIAPTPEGHPDAIPIQLNDPRHPERTGTVYKIDMRPRKDSSAVSNPK